MTDTPIKMCFLAAIMLNGILCGASLDQSIKQLPARHMIGMRAYSEYARAAELGNGIIWYIIISFGAGLSTMATAALVWLSSDMETYSLPIYVGAGFAFSYIICTIACLPYIYRQKQFFSEERLKKMFIKFEKMQTVRSILIVLTLLSFMWSLLLIMMS